MPFPPPHHASHRLANRLVALLGAGSLVVVACSDNDAAPVDNGAGSLNDGGAGGSAGEASGGTGGTGGTNGFAGNGGGGTKGGSAGAGADGNFSGSGGSGGTDGNFSGSGGGGLGGTGGSLGGTGGSLGGTGGGGTGGGFGGAGSPSFCGEGVGGAPQIRRICYSPAGLVNPPENFGAGGYVYTGCKALERAPGSACPAAADACVPSAFCDVKDAMIVGEATLENDACCYDTSICMGASGCGRPILVDDQAIVAPLLRGEGVWGGSGLVLGSGASGWA